MNTCPACGYCPHCGRSAYPFLPGQMAPYYQPYPYHPWVGPWPWGGATWQVGNTGAAIGAGMQNVQTV